MSQRGTKSEGESGVPKGIKIGGEMGMKKVVDSWRCFSKDPVLATRIMIDMAGRMLLGVFNPVYKKYEQDLEVCKRNCPEVSCHSLAIGTGVLLAVLFGVFCAVAYAIQVLVIP